MGVEKSYTELVNNYFEEVRSEINKRLVGKGSVDIQKIVEILHRKRKYVYDFLTKRKIAHFSNEEVDKKLLEDEFGSPSTVAEYVLYEVENLDRFSLFPPDGVWLGVCSGIARKFGVETLWVRMLFFVSGLLLGIGLVLYLLAFFYLYRNSQGIQRLLKFSWLKLVWNFVWVMIVIVSIFVGFLAILGGLYYLYVVYVGVLKETEWLEKARSLAITLTLVLGLVSGVFSVYASLPLLKGWDETFRNLRNAVLALFIFFIFIDLVYILVRMVIIALNTLLL